MTTTGHCRHLRRSFLYVPGSEERKLAKAQTLGADAVILDLEDSVAPERKAEARERILGLLRTQTNPAVEWLIRLNGLASAHFRADLACGVAARPAGVVIPKVEDPVMLREVDARLGAAEREAGHPVGSLRLFAMIESARAVLNAQVIAAATPRVQALILGHVDLLRDLGLTPDWRGQNRPACALSSRAGGSRGRGGRRGCHLSQYPGSRRIAQEVIKPPAWALSGNKSFIRRRLRSRRLTPSAERVRRAERILEVWQKAQAEGKGVVTLDGMLLEPPVIAMEQLVLERARQAG
jgi:citrate lyase beta subunit